MASRFSDVLKCEGYTKDFRAEFVPSPMNSLDVLLLHGSYGVEDVQIKETEAKSLWSAGPRC